MVHKLLFHLASFARLLQCISLYCNTVMNVCFFVLRIFIRIQKNNVSWLDGYIHVYHIHTSTQANFIWQLFCDNFYLLVHMRKFARILCDKCICWKIGVPVFMWQIKIFICESLLVHDSSQKIWHIFISWQWFSGLFTRNQDGGFHAWLGGSSNVCPFRSVKNVRKLMEYQIQEL